ncbi:MAG: hypothetical protein KDA41_18315, partial [Planctomycetales bacterium]|nr:hypothetical protein [Planctomycetales bacterium]
MTLPTARAWLLLLWAVGISDVAWGDTFELVGGGEIVGQLVNVEQNPRQTYVVQTGAGSQVTLTVKQVSKFVAMSEPERHYEKLLRLMPMTAEGNWKMAYWCQQQGLDDLRQMHLREVLRFDPEHREARLGLGYTSIDGKWVKTDEWNRARGLVYHQGDWRTPQEVRLMSLNQKFDDAQQKWKPALKRYRDNLNSRN